MPSTDICKGAHIIFINALTRADKEKEVSNNEQACEQCYHVLSNEERQICEEVD